MQDIIILAAAPSLNGYFGPLACINKDFLIANTIKKNKPHANIYVVGGHKIDKLKKVIGNEVNLIINEEWDKYNSGRSLQCGLEAIKSNSLIIIHGNAFFDNFNLLDLAQAGTSVLLRDQWKKRKKIGCLVKDNRVVSLGYRFKQKWAKAIHLENQELEYIKLISRHSNFKHLFDWEIMNLLINHGFSINSVLTEKKVKDIDSDKDI